MVNHREESLDDRTDAALDYESNSYVQPDPREVDPTAVSPLDTDEDQFLLEQYRSVLEKFQDINKEDPTLKDPVKPEVFYDSDEIPEEKNEGRARLSKKKRKEESKLSIAELKALVKRPEVVDWTDTSSQDPRLLVALKSYRNVVPVPSHWSLKREYLSSKRGVEKPPFALPKFIQDTGISEMRDAKLEQQDQASLKQKQRERVQPKMGKLDIDYGKLYEAFFRFQTKPELTRYGEVYYEGKEYETNLRHLRPGELSDELKEALNMPPGAPPPWLINQQRFGPPPSYPSLKIPGLNAPPPPGASWGYHPGGFGKPPVDEFNRPIFGGDIFGVMQPQQNQQMGEPVEKSLWGELQEPQESEEEEESGDEDEDMDEDEMASGLQTQGGIRSSTTGTASMAPSAYGGTESVKDDFNLRKQHRRGTETEESSYARQAGQVVPEQSVQSKGFFGSDRGYDLRGAQGSRDMPVLGQEERSRKRKAGDIDVSVDMDALQRDGRLSKDEIHKRYEAQKRNESGPWSNQFDQDDLSNMIAEESSKRLKRDEERRNRR